MQLRGFIPVAIVCIGVTAVPGTTAVATEQPPAAPLQLKKFTKAPVSSSATRTVKKANGNYTRVVGYRLKKKDTANAPEQVHASIAQSSEATNAYASVMDAQVRIVSEDEVNEVDLAADSNPIIPIAVTTSTEAVPVVDANEINSIDQSADQASVAAASATSTKSEPIAIAQDQKSWVQRMMDGLNVVIATATIAVKALFA